MPLMLVSEEREPRIPVPVILLGSPLFPWWWTLSEAGAVKKWRLLKPLVAFKDGPKAWSAFIRNYKPHSPTTSYQALAGECIHVAHTCPCIVTSE